MTNSGDVAEQVGGQGRGQRGQPDPAAPGPSACDAEQVEHGRRRRGRPRRPGRSIEAMLKASLIGGLRRTTSCTKPSPTTAASTSSSVVRKNSPSTIGAWLRVRLWLSRPNGRCTAKRGRQREDAGDGRPPQVRRQVRQGGRREPPQRRPRGAEQRADQPDQAVRRRSRPGRHVTIVGHPGALRDRFVRSPGLSVTRIGPSVSSRWSAVEPCRRSCSRSTPAWCEFQIAPACAGASGSRSRRPGRRRPRLSMPARRAAATSARAARARQRRRGRGCEQRRSWPCAVAPGVRPGGWGRGAGIRRMIDVALSWNVP